MFTAKEREEYIDFSYIGASHTASSIINSTPTGKFLIADGPVKYIITPQSPLFTLKFPLLYFVFTLVLDAMDLEMCL